MNTADDREPLASKQDLNGQDLFYLAVLQLLSIFIHIHAELMALRILRSSKRETLRSGAKRIMANARVVRHKSLQIAWVSSRASCCGKAKVKSNVNGVFDVSVT
jgi:hypothetical protein